VRARVLCEWNVDEHYKSAISGGDKSRWVVGACELLVLGHWCCLAASHHALSPSLSRSMAVARPPFPRYREQQLSQQPLSKVS